MLEARRRGIDARALRAGVVAHVAGENLGVVVDIERRARLGEEAVVVVEIDAGDSRQGEAREIEFRFGGEPRGVGGEAVVETTIGAVDADERACPVNSPLSLPAEPSNCAPKSGPSGKAKVPST
jgi:hypothetical protein